MASLHRLLLRAAGLGCALLVAAGAARAVDLGSLAPIKRTQARMLASEPMRERAERAERRRELRRLAATLRARGGHELRARGESARRDAEDEDVRARGAVARATPARATRPAAVQTPPRANVRCNDPATDYMTGEGQCETSIARLGRYMVAAWNDGKGFDSPSGTADYGQIQGWATSVDSGVTWIDHDVPPLPPGYTNWHWSSDPVLAVNPTTGAFYYAALGDVNGSSFAVGVARGRFTGDSFVWDTAKGAVTSSSDLLDKEWLAVDPVNGRVYLSFTRFINQSIAAIDVMVADSLLANFTGPVEVSTSSERGLVQGSRPIVGFGGTAYVAYYLIGSIDADSYRITRSTDGGITWSTPNTAVSFYPNFASGAPGFNRDMGIQFPAIATDRSGGTHNGRLYLAWNESLDWFPDEPSVGNAGSLVETEPNDTSTTATPASVGLTLRGSLKSSTDFDYYALDLAAGQSILAECDSLASLATVTLRLFAPDGTTRLCFTTQSASDIALGYAPVTWVFTAPTAGRYYLRVASYNGGSGPYVVRTGFTHNRGERGRDQRDVFAAHSDDGGVTWSAPVRVSNSPVGYDDWLPEVAVAGDGEVYCGWYDWRDAAPETRGGQSNTYLAQSNDGGDTWNVLGATSDATSAWTNVATNIAPNEGDYMSLFADGAGLVAAWSDGRDGKPNVYMARWRLGETTSQPVLTLAAATDHAVNLAWSVAAAPGFAATLVRRTGTDATTDTTLATLVSDASHALAFSDTAVVLHRTYTYRLAVLQNGVTYYYGQATITVGQPTVQPTGGGSIALAGAWPNPVTLAGRSGSRIRYTLGSSARATLEILDVRGRSVSKLDVTQASAGSYDLWLYRVPELSEPGIYFARLDQGGHTRTQRFVLLKSQ